LRWGTEKAKSALDMAADAISRSRAGKVDTDNGGGIGRVVRICLALEAQEDLEVLSALLSCAGSVRYEIPHFARLPQACNGWVGVTRAIQTRPLAATAIDSGLSKIAHLSRFLRNVEPLYVLLTTSRPSRHSRT
jgi:hypothetical protein